MKKTIHLLFPLFLFFSCSTSKTTTISTDDGLIEIQFLHVNDVYEIAPLPGDNRGGLARVATLKKRLLAENKNTIAVLPGDFLNPSVIGTLDDEDGKSIKGKHMVDVMNHAGIDMVTFGNHEFDLKEKDLQKRLDESEFEWVTSNVFKKEKGELSAFFKNKNEKRKKKEFFQKTIIKTFTDEDGTSITIGFFAVTIDSKVQPYVRYEDYMQTAEKMMKELFPQVDLIIPLTHLDIEDDLKLAKKLPHFPLIMGGHDHDNMRFLIDGTVVAKADANAKTAFVHTLKYNANDRNYIVYSELVKIDKTIPEEATTKARVDYWKKIAADDLEKKGFDATESIAFLSSPIDGRESTVRGGQSELGQLVASSIRAACKNNVDAAVLNSGSIRVDDMLHGNLTQYDIIRILPYPSKIIEVEMTGVLFKKLLEASAQNRGEGAYLQLNGIEYDEPSLSFKIGNELLRTDRNYIIAMNDFLLAGYDYKFLTKETDGIVKITEPNAKSALDLRNDLRKAVIEFLKSK